MWRRGGGRGEHVRHLTYINRVCIFFNVESLILIKYVVVWCDVCV